MYTCIHQYVGTYTHIYTHTHIPGVRMAQWLKRCAINLQFMGLNPTCTRVYGMFQHTLPISDGYGLSTYCTTSHSGCLIVLAFNEISDRCSQI